MNSLFTGTGVALVTPFLENSEVDFNALEKLVNHCINGGVEYLVVMGTTGESATLSKDEKAAIIRKVVQVNNGRVPLVLGVGGNCTADVVNALSVTDFTGYSAILSVCPYYNKPTQEGIYQHYKMIAENSPLPVILYNVPGRTGVNMLPATTLRLARDFQNIIAVKEASGNLAQIMEIVQNKPDSFLVISGDDNLTMPIVLSGAAGVISVVANAYPKEFSEMVRQSLNMNVVEARKLHYKLLNFMNYIFMDGSPGGVKIALDEMAVCKPVVRLPLVQVNTSVRQLILDFVKSFS
jgi:4-hydroxy-tetrahydrodipicolinate synthase